MEGDVGGVAGGAPALLKPVLGVDLDYLHSSPDEMRQRFGPIETYIAERVWHRRRPPTGPARYAHRALARGWVIPGVCLRTAFSIQPGVPGHDVVGVAADPQP